jgi:hypothetical protein
MGPVDAPASIERFVMSVIVGAVFTVFTVRTKLSLEVRTPSLTVTVSVAVPEALAVGVTVSVRLAPLPPKTMFAFGTSAVFEDVALKTRRWRRSGSRPP